MFGFLTKCDFVNNPQPLRMFKMDSILFCFDNFTEWLIVGAKDRSSGHWSQMDRNRIVHEKNGWQWSSWKVFWIIIAICRHFFVVPLSFMTFVSAIDWIAATTKCPEHNFCDRENMFLSNNLSTAQFTFIRIEFYELTTSSNLCKVFAKWVCCHYLKINICNLVARKMSDMSTVS